MRLLFKNHPQQGFLTNICNAYKNFNNLHRIQNHMQIALKALVTVGMVFSAGVGFYSFQFIITSLHSLEFSLAIVTFITSVLAFFQLAKYNYFH